MSRRPSVLVLGLTVGDYLLWNWSLNGSHDVIALISGLTLPPLVLVSLWVLVLGAVRLIAGLAQLAGADRRPGTARGSTSRSRAAPASAPSAPRHGPAPTGPAGQSAAGPAPGRSGKIAA